MPLPTIIQVPAWTVRSSDDLLVNDQKENTQDGTPCPVAFVDDGEKWAYVNLQEPVGRKRVFKFPLREPVWVVRMEDTEEDKLRKTNDSIVDLALRTQRRAWTMRNEMAADLELGATLSSGYYAWRGDRAVEVSAESALREADTLLKLERKCGAWRDVYVAVTNGDHEHPLAGVRAERELLERRILEGYGTADEDNAYREWLRDTLRWEEDE